MSRTGSTSEQNWPTRWRPRLRLALVAGLLLTVATTASAGWTPRDVPGTPNDVEVWDATRFSVSTSSGAYLLSTDGGTLASLPSDSAFPTGTYLLSHGCFIGFMSNGSVVSPGTCTSEWGPFGDSYYSVIKVKATETGAAYAVAREPALGDSRVAYSPPSGFETRPWLESQQTLSGTAMTVGVLSQGASEHALVAVSVLREVRLHWLTDGAQAVRYTIADAGVPPKEVQTIDLFPAGGTAPTALFGWDNGLYRGPLTRDGGYPFQEVPLPGGPGSVTAVDVNTGAGAQYGDGFGMATVRRDGGVALLRAVPTDQPQDIGIRWEATGTIPALLSPRYLECRGAKLCVIAQTATPPANVFVYTNDEPPQITVTPELPEPFSLSEGMSRTVSVRTTDTDGDAVRLSVTPSSLSRPGFTLTPTLVNGGVDLALNAGTVCASFTEPITITATDGLDEHAVVQKHLLQVQHTLQPDAPVITPSGTIVVPAGTGRQTFMANASSACAIREYRWTPLSPNSPELAVSGVANSTAAFTPPAVVCNTLGETHLYRVEAIDEGGLASPGTDITIQVLPWGAPNAPFEPNRQVLVLAGESVSAPVWLKPNTPTHPCEGSNAGFPGVETVWELPGGVLPPPGVRLLAQDGTPITGSSAVTPELGISAAECTDTQFAIDVQHYTPGTPGPVGTVSRVVVQVDKNWNPVSEGKVTLSTTSSTAESVAGIAGVEGIRCLEQREALGFKARLALKRDEVVLREEIVPVPGPWRFTLGDACLGGTYQLEAELLSGSGLRARALPGGAQGLGAGGSSVVVSEPISVPPVERAKLQPMEAPHLTARCGAPATGTLEQRPLAPCSELPVSWEQVGGPALTQTAFTGSRVDVATQEADFGALIGQKVVMRMSARTVQETSLDQEIPITVEPFVELQRRTERGTGTDTGLVGVSVELRNTTECGVSQVEHWEHLEGLDYQPGSARFDDTPVEAELEGDLLKVRGLVLEGGTTGLLTYVVRPRLLESARFGGQSFVREVSVSSPLEDPPAAGCGCAGGGSGLAALGLAGLAAALRRRRGR
jgi:uncharacterized protein (TIGR03382 family)